MHDLQEYFDKNTDLQTKMSRQAASQLTGLDVKVNIDTGEIETLNGILRQGTAEFETMAEKLDEISKSNGIVENLGINFKEVVSLIGIGTDRTEEQTQALQKLIQPMGIATKELLNQFISHVANNREIESSVMIQKQYLKLMAK